MQKCCAFLSCYHGFKSECEHNTLHLILWSAEAISTTWWQHFASVCFVMTWTSSCLYFLSSFGSLLTLNSTFVWYAQRHKNDNLKEQEHSMFLCNSQKFLTASLELKIRARPMMYMKDTSHLSSEAISWLLHFLRTRKLAWTLTVA